MQGKAMLARRKRETTSYEANSANAIYKAEILWEADLPVFPSIPPMWRIEHSAKQCPMNAHSVANSDALYG